MTAPIHVHDALSLHLREGMHIVLSPTGPQAPPPHPVLDHSPKLRERLQEYGLKCLGNKWRGWHAKHRFLCSQGHKVSIDPASLVNVRWHWRCATCRDEALLQRLCDSAALANARCLSKTWRSVQALYRFRCNECAHQWNHRPRDIACPPCSRQRARESRRLADGLQRLQAKAAEHGGQCLSGAYLGSAVRHRFRCAEGHEWEPVAHEVVRGAWCLPCSHERKRTEYRLADGLERLQQAAADKGGACLSDTYEGNRHRYAFRCADGHEWQTLGARILRGAWCPTCVVAQQPQKRRLSDGLQRLHEIAKAKGGECLSDRYNGQTGQHRFRCGEGHEWEARGAVTLQRGGWCPQCALVGRRLGLEAAKAAAQARGGLCLSDIYVSSDTKMAWQCDQGHVWQTKFDLIRRGAWCRTCANAHRPSRPLLSDGLQRLSSLAQAKGGVCLSDIYLGDARLHRFRCQHGHEWETRASGVVNGAWCLQCARDDRKLGIEAARAAAMARGGQCLSDTYVNGSVKMSWMCDRGHVWQTRFTVIRRGAWCPECAHMAQITNKNSKARARYEAVGHPA